MQSKAADVGSYLEEVPAERREALTRLRALCRETLVGYTATMEYGMPCYGRGGVVEVSFASQKQYIALYVLKQKVLERHRGELAGCSVGKSCIRFRKPEQMDFELIRRMLRESAESDGPVC